MKHSKKFWKQLGKANRSVEALHKTVAQIRGDVGGAANAPGKIQMELFTILKHLEAVGDEFYDLQESFDRNEI